MLDPLKIETLIWRALPGAAIGGAIGCIGCCSSLLSTLSPIDKTRALAYLLAPTAIGGLIGAALLDERAKRRWRR